MKKERKTTRKKGRYTEIKKRKKDRKTERMKDKTAISSLMQNLTPNLLIKLQLGLIGVYTYVYIYIYIYIL